ncbi:MAG: YlmC/YmxH family sporulation protein [Thermincolia bacterium]
MRISELVGKEIVNIVDGARLGVVGDSDVIIDLETGCIESIILPNRGNVLSFWATNRQHLIIPWQAIKKIGSEIIIVELDQCNPNPNRYAF